MMATPIETFVPLAADPVAADPAKAFRMMTVDQPADAQSQRSWPSVVTANPPPACEPRISLVREKDRVTGIHIQCSCGQVIDLVCVYPADAQAS